MADRNLRLQVILEGLDRLTSPLRSITGASAAARQDLARTHEQLKALDAQQQQVGRYKAAETRYADDARQYEALQARLAALRQQLDATEAPTKKLRAEFEKVERQTGQTAQRLEQGGAALQKLSAGLGAAGIDVLDLARHEERLATQTQEANATLRQQTAQLDKVNAARRASEKMGEISSKATGMGLSAIAAGTATAAPLVVATKQAMTLESAMADVRKVVNFPPQAFAQMSDDILEMSTRIPMSAEGIAQIVAAAGRAAVPRKELLGFAEDAAKMGVAFDSTAEEAGTTMAKWRTAFELPQSGVVALADQINALTNSFGGDVGAVTDMVTRIGPLGKVGGLAASQIAAMSQVLSSVGVESEVGATGIKAMMLALTKGAAATRSQRDAFKSLGLDAGQVAKDMQRDAGGTITDVMKRLQALPKEAQAGALTDLFGSESVAAIAPMLTSLDQLQANFALVGDKSQYAGSMNQEYLSAVSTTQGATGLAANALSGLNITMGQALLPTVVAVSEGDRGGQCHAPLGAGTPGDDEGDHAVSGGGGRAAGPAGRAGAGLWGADGCRRAAGHRAGAAAADRGGHRRPRGGGLSGLRQLGADQRVVRRDLAGHQGHGLGRAGVSGQCLPDLHAAGPAGSGLRARAGLSAIAQFYRDRAQPHSGADQRDYLDARRGGGDDHGVGSSLVTLLKAKLGIHSPSRVFAGLGGFVMAGLDQGLADNTAGPLQRIASLSDAMTAGFRADGGAMLGRIGDASGQIASAVALGAAVPAAAMPAPAPGRARPPPVSPRPATRSPSTPEPPRRPTSPAKCARPSRTSSASGAGAGLAMDKEARDAPDGPWPVPLPDPHARPRRIAAQDRLALCPLGPRGRARCGAVSGGRGRENQPLGLGLCRDHRWPRLARPVARNGRSGRGAAPARWQRAGLRQLRDRGDRRAPRRAHGRWPPAADRLCHRPSAGR
jgi:TP901 family phage tail tape measure protein